MKEEDDNIIILDEIKTCQFTGKKYDAIIKVKCPCDCHANSSVMHFMPCCIDGWEEKRRYIK